MSHSASPCIMVCIVMYHDDQSPSTSTCSTFPDWGGSRAQRQTRNPHMVVSHMGLPNFFVKRQKNKNKKTMLNFMCGRFGSIFDGFGHRDRHGWTRRKKSSRLYEFMLKIHKVRCLAEEITIKQI